MRREKLVCRVASKSLAIIIAALFIAAASTLALSQTENVIYSFRSGSDGRNPYATFVIDKSGNLYGTTAFGGGSLNCGTALDVPIGCGTVYKISFQNGRPSESVLYAFTSLSDGGVPYGGLVLDSSGNLYGTTTRGGANSNGTLFQLTPPASPGGVWTENVIYNLTASNNGYPIYPILDKAGNLYFEEPEGGAAGIGAVSRLSPPATKGGTWTYTQLYAFLDWSNGSLPIGTLTFDRSGDLYGVTANGGDMTNCPAYGCGEVFELVPTASGEWTENILYEFQVSPDANQPYSGVIFDSKGNLYGTTQQGGVNGSLYGGYGAIYELSPPTQAGGTWTEQVLYNFSNGSDGAGPRDALVLDSQGNLYGTTITAAAFELSPPALPGGSWTETTLHNFTPNTMYAGLSSRSGNMLTLFGATVAGGTRNFGTVFRIVP